jgi:hypothetical protein
MKPKRDEKQGADATTKKKNRPSKVGGVFKSKLGTLI